MKIKAIGIILVLISNIYASYPDFDILVNEGHYSQNMFVSHRSDQIHYLAIFNPDLNLEWYIISDDGKGWDFKVNNNQHLTYYRKQSGESETPFYWFVMDSYMQEIDTLDCVNGYIPDYHDIQYTDSGGYILQAYATEAIDIPETDGIDSVNILVIQEFDQNHNLLFF